MYFKRDRFVKNGSILFTSLSGKQRCCFFRAGLLLRDERTDEDLAGPGRKDREAPVCDGSSEQGVAAKDPGGRRIAFGLKQKDERKNGFMG